MKITLSSTLFIRFLQRSARLCGGLSVFGLTWSLVGGTPVHGKEGAEQLFVRRVMPMMQDKCLACHGKDENKIKGGLDLRTWDSLLLGGDSAEPSVVAGKPEQSPFYLAITRRHDEWEPMPPKENDALTPEQIAYVKDWIAAGAPWPDAARSREILAQKDKWSADGGVEVATSGGLSEDWTHRRYKPEDLWAYQPVKKPTVPAVGAKNPIDAFIHARLAEAGLTPAPRADRRTLLRRVTFGLTGLPPTPEETTAFLEDPAPDAEAFSKVVERLLASPHYGERMGQHWLDVVRYADSSGFANDYGRANTWRYRDYVVRAFNHDKPYDQFVKEQIAGDELTPTNPEGIIASGMLRMGPWELTGMEVPRVARQKFLDDVTDSVGQVFIAQPLQCARCHDHKFDPIPTGDYYSFVSIFATTQMAERPAPFLSEENLSFFEERKYLEQRADFNRRTLANIDAKAIEGARAWYAENKKDPAVFEAALTELLGKNRGAAKRDADYQDVRTALMKRGIPEDQLPPRYVGLSPTDLGHQRIAKKGLERERWDRDRYEAFAFATYSGRTPDVKTVAAPQRMRQDRMTNGELEEGHILTGGDPFANGAPVKPGVLSAVTSLGGMDPSLGEVPSAIEGRRTALATWIASASNPLTARTYVNRLWLWHFNQAIAGNPNNFGVMGKKPTDPALLDFLAAALMENGWSTKAMHRLILTSDAYARASTHPHPEQVKEQDPDGTRYAVFRPRRLTAEELRDASLALSGELNPAIGGIPSRPEMNREAALQPRQVMGTFAEAWQPSATPAERHRRSLYALRIRGQPDPYFEVFNAPNPDLSCEMRDASTVTPQVFSLFNSQATLDRAVAWAARIAKESRTPPESINRAFMLAFNRSPTPEEQQACLDHWQVMTKLHHKSAIPKAERPREVVREGVEENTGEKFVFTEPLEVYADFVPDLHISDVPPATRGLAELCLVLLNSNEFVYVY